MAFLVGSAKRKEIFLEIASCNNSKDQQFLDFLKIGDEDVELDESMVVIESGSKRHLNKPANVIAKGCKAFR